MFRLVLKIVLLLFTAIVLLTLTAAQPQPGTDSPQFVYSERLPNQRSWLHLVDAERAVRVSYLLYAYVDQVTWLPDDRGLTIMARRNEKSRTYILDLHTARMDWVLHQHFDDARTTAIAPDYRHVALARQGDPDDLSVPPVLEVLPLTPGQRITRLDEPHQWPISISEAPPPLGSWNVYGTSWSPDGAHINMIMSQAVPAVLTSSPVEYRFQTVLADADGRVLKTFDRATVSFWLDNGSLLAMQQYQPERGTSMGVLYHLADDRLESLDTRSLLPGGPDAAQIAFIAPDAAGRDTLYLRALPDGPQRALFTDPSGDGLNAQSLWWQSDQRHIMVQAGSTGPMFSRTPTYLIDIHSGNAYSLPLDVQPWAGVHPQALLLTAWTDRGMMLYDLSDARYIPLDLGPTHSVHDFKWSPSGEWLVVDAYETLPNAIVPGAMLPRLYLVPLGRMLRSGTPITSESLREAARLLPTSDMLDAPQWSPDETRAVFFGERGQLLQVTDLENPTLTPVALGALSQWHGWRLSRSSLQAQP